MEGLLSAFWEKQAPLRKLEGRVPHLKNFHVHLWLAALRSLARGIFYYNKHTACALENLSPNYFAVGATNGQMGCCCLGMENIMAVIVSQHRLIGHQHLSWVDAVVAPFLRRSHIVVAVFLKTNSYTSQMPFYHLSHLSLKHIKLILCKCKLST